MYITGPQVHHITPFLEGGPGPGPDNKVWHWLLVGTSGLPVVAESSQTPIVRTCGSWWASAEPSCHRLQSAGLQQAGEEGTHSYCKRSFRVSSWLQKVLQPSHDPRPLVPCRWARLYYAAASCCLQVNSRNSVHILADLFAPRLDQENVVRTMH